ncbi:MAG: methylated-DNA--[protein]-cysteine S-methyltransferase [Rhodospirillaceae bacterium]|nr:methylated-DNA--[protein]-cysteine S-methyltransferase [Rhodospirillaceae bacterium]
MTLMTAPADFDVDTETLADRLADPLADRSRDYARIEQAIGFIVAARPEHPRLEDVAAHVGLSPFHLQRLFKRWAGVSPKQLMGYLTLEHAKQVMRQSASVLDTTYEVGLSGPSRLHDLFVTYEAMTPGEYGQQGARLVIRHGVHDTPFGRALVLVTDRGVCGVEFIGEPGAAAALDAARARWPLSRFVADDAATAAVARDIFAGGAHRHRLLLKGTNFQVQVWAALLRVPAGAVVSYGDVARAIGKPSAARAVGAALAANAVAYLVPCHRVLRGTGAFEGYRWGPDRRRAVLAWDAAKAATTAAAG